MTLAARLLLGAMLVLLGGVLGAWRFVLAPLARLADAADRIGSGELGARASLGRHARGVREVGAAFDRMSEALVARESERDRAEAARQVGEARLARLLATTPAGVMELDAEGRFLYANAAAERMLGAQPGGLVGLRYDDPAWKVAAAHDGAPVPPDRLPGAWALRQGEQVRDYEHAVTTLDGRRAVLLVDVVPVRERDGTIGGALAAFQDVTARHVQAAALRGSEERYRTLFEAIDAGFCIIEMRFDEAQRRPIDYRFVEVNPAFEKQTGLADAAGKWMRDLVPAHEQHWFDIYGRVALTGEPARFENAAEALGRWFDVHAFRIGDPASHRVAVLFNDITGRRRAELELRESEAALRRLNETLEARVAARTAELRQALDALHAEALEREQAEEQLRQAQKMEAVGQLTGGIAHDFNNMLQGIGGALDMVRRRMEQGRTAEVGRYVDAALKTAERAASLTHRLLAFARRQALQPRVIEVDALIAGMEELIRRTVGPAVRVELRLGGVDGGGGARTVLCDPNQLENALLNLAINARDAMPEGGNGKLTIAARDLRLTEAEIAAATGRRGTVAAMAGQDGAKPGEYVEIAVSDTGMGMDEATRARAFEPFFTTKPIGQGTGLGLSQLYGFVRQSGGIVRLDSAPGQGTTVWLLLPRHDAAGSDRRGDRDGAREREGRPTAAAQAGIQTTEAAAAADGAAGAGRTVLLVEDEAEVRAVAAERLRELGYRVLEAADGAGALRLLGLPNGAVGRMAEAPPRVSVLVTDVGLPGGLNGRQLAEAARERRPDLPVLFITGYAGGALERELAPGMAVIGKPFTLDALAAKLCAVLDGAAPAA